MNEEQFRRELQKNNASYHYNAERPEAIIECYRKKWRNEFDRVSLDQIELTFLEWWESYYKLNPTIIAQTNTSFKKNRIICYLGKYKIIIITNKTIFCHLSNQTKLPKQISSISNVKKIHFQSSD